MRQNDHSWRIGQRIAPVRFLVFMAIMAAGATVAWSSGFAHGRALMIGFDAGAAFFLISLWPLLGAETVDMRARARANDANRAWLLAITALVTTVILVVVAVETTAPPSGHVIVLTIATLVLAWLFSNVVYALHYAHLYYLESAGKDSGGLDFPGGGEPHYWDFLYFSFTLGMTFQTSDVGLTAQRMRRVAIGQCLAAFVFNIGVLAFTINVLGSAGGH
ncbi:MAG: DUF1345 domain-containing protein [Sphingomonas sp.]|nr:DUF1345 domain-containing protein [Sphingomonas sp.]